MDINYVHSELLECSRYGEVDDLKLLLKEAKDNGIQFNINYADEGGNTALHKASANGHEECMKVLFELGAEMLRNLNGNLPTHWAAQNGKLNSLQFLIQFYTVDILSKNDFGVSVLSCAFQSNNPDVIAICLSHPS